MRCKLITCLLVSCLPSFAAYSFQLLDGNVRLELQARKSDTKLALCIIPNLLNNEPDTIASKDIDANGNAIIALRISKSIFIQLKVGKQTNTLLLNPNDNLRVLIDSSDVVSFEGKGEAASRYLAESSAILRKNEQVEGNHFLLLGPDKFVKHLALLKHLFEEHNTTFFSKNVVSQSDRHLLEARGNMQLLAYKLNYAMAQYQGDLSTEIHPELKRAIHEVPFDDQLLYANMPEYAMVLSFYSQLGVYGSLVSGKTKEEITAFQDQLPWLADQKITKTVYPANVRSFLRVKNFIELLNRGISTKTDSLLKEIQQEPDYTLYAPAVTKKYIQWQALSAGKQAPEFSGVMKNGNAFSLSSLKNQIVYIDVWATWCGPCIQEMPASKVLQKRFEGNEKVVFLYVSIDSDQQAWKQYLAKNIDLKGEHINLPRGAQFQAFWKDYQFSSIPRYILIDQKGNLVDANASRPSSRKAEEAIRILLN